MNHRSPLPWYSLSLVFSLCLCSMLVTFGGGMLLMQREPEMLNRSASDNQRWQRQHADTAWLVQQLNFEFTEEQLKEGQQVYSQYCASCHGPDGQGQFPQNPLEPDSTGRIGAPPHDETGHSWHHSDVVLIRYILEGGFSDLTRFYLMPAFGDLLTDAQIIAVLAYIKTMWTPEQLAMQRQLTYDEQRLFAD